MSYIGCYGKTNGIRKKRKEVIRSILGPSFDNGKLKLKSNKVIYERIENITDSIRKWRVTFYGHIKKMNGDRLAKKKLDYFDKNPKMQLNWIKEIRQDLEEMELTQTDALNISVFRKYVKSFGDFRETKKRTTDMVWRRREHSK